MPLDYFLDFADSHIINQDIKNKFLLNYKKSLAKDDKTGLTKAEKILDMLNHLKLSSNQIEDFLQGAHFILEDDGVLYNHLKALGYERISSHYPNTKPQSDIGIKAGHLFEQLLVGTNGTHTWFQIEYSAMPQISDILSNSEAFIDFLAHARDYVIYVGGGKQTNIGQYGTSPFTEYKPTEPSNCMHPDAVEYIGCHIMLDNPYNF